MPYLRAQFGPEGCGNASETPVPAVVRCLQNCWKDRRAAAKPSMTRDRSDTETYKRKWEEAEKRWENAEKRVKVEERQKKEEAKQKNSYKKLCSHILANPYREPKPNKEGGKTSKKIKGNEVTCTGSFGQMNVV